MNWGPDYPRQLHAFVRLRFAEPATRKARLPEHLPPKTRRRTQLCLKSPRHSGPARAGGLARPAAARPSDSSSGRERRVDADQRPKAPYARAHRTLRLDSSTRTPLGWAAVNGQSTPCAACRPEFESATQTRSRANLDQAAGPRTVDNLALNSATNSPARWRRPAGDISDRETRPVAEA